MANLHALSQALDALPCLFEGNRLNLLFLDNINIVYDGDAYLRALAAPGLLAERRDVLLSARPQQRVHSFRCPTRPDPEAVSALLFEHFHAVPRLVLPQEELAAYVAREAQRHQPDVVLFVVADGLSYYDLPDSDDLQPCFVTGPTITPHGYQASIGRPPLARYLFGLDYHHQAAFTYFDIESNALAQKLHSAFSPSQVHRIRAFHDIAQHAFVRNLRPGSYIQVTTTALDGLCHNHRDLPPIEAYKQKLLANFEALVDVCSQNNRRVLACLTADHGILWRDVLSGFITIDAPTAAHTSHARYLQGGLLRDYAVSVKTQAGTFSLLKSPYVSRALRSNEWGVHGGVSAWESLVPLKIIKT